MAPKVKPTGAKGKGAAKARKAATPIEPVPAVAETSLVRYDDTPRKRERDQTERRCIMEKVERKLKCKLGHLPEFQWRGKVNKQGISVEDFVGNELAKSHGDDRRLSTKFWTKVFTEFSLRECLSELLKEPEENETIDRDLLLVINHARSGNPAADPAAMLERYLGYCERVLNRSELWDIFRGVEESPQVSRAVSSRCFVAVLSYFSRTARG